MRPQILIVASLFLSSFAHAVTVTGFDQTAVSIENPKRIVAINPTTTEIIFALGEGARIVGVDAGAQYPEAAVAKIEKVGHPYRPSVEGIISLKPDLVIATEENLPPASVEQLRSAKVPVLILEPSDKGGVEGYKRRVNLIAEVLGQKAKGQTEIARFEAAIKKVEDKIKTGAKSKPKVFFFYAHGPASGRIYGNATGPHYLIEAAGAENAAHFIDGVKDFTSEAMVKMSPDAILVLKRVSKGMGGPAGVLKMPGVALTPAGKSKTILEIDDSVRWIGPRFPELVEDLHRQLKL